MNNEQGLTLVEVMASVVILGIVVLAFVTISSYSGLAGKNSTEVNEARLRAESLLNTLRSENAATLQTAIANVNDQTQYAAEKFAVSISSTPLIAGATSYQLPKDASVRSKLFTSTGIVYVNQTPTLLAVTVSW